MAHEEAEIVRQRLCFKERDHVHTDGTRRGRNREAALMLQGTRPRTKPTKHVLMLIKI
jgi:hypothetical protein